MQILISFGNLLSIFLLMYRNKAFLQGNPAETLWAVYKIFSPLQCNAPENVVATLFY